MLAGVFPATHTVHENARPIPATTEVAAERLRKSGYRTAAFVSSFTLARQFGLARGFDIYDDALLAGAVERGSKETTDAAMAYVAQTSSQPLFLWVHYFDPLSFHLSSIVACCRHACGSSTARYRAVSRG